jgi:transposase InsO family protein
LIHHSDRGVQYASAQYRNAMQSAGFRASMSRKADCYDNAPMESFFHARGRLYGRTRLITVWLQD